MSIPVFVLQVRVSVKNTIKLLLLFKQPINLETLICGSMVTNIWIWSGQRSASKISTPLRSHRSRRIFPMSTLIWL